MTTIVCGVDGSPGARSAIRIAAALAGTIGARLVAVHVLDRLVDAGTDAERVAASVLYDEVRTPAPPPAERWATSPSAWRRWPARRRQR